jgi:pyruvate/2-oxoglutarate dehydrogenase complex dihydrolipoamide acyltransferase (E2) component
VRHDEVNIGIAVALEDGLVVPVIQRADTLRVAEIGSRRKELVTRAQSGKLCPADISGGDPAGGASRIAWCRSTAARPSRR